MPLRTAHLLCGLLAVVTTFMFLSAASPVALATHQAPAQGAPAWLIAGRYDDARMVILVAEASMSQREAQSLRPAYTEERATLIGDVFEVGGDRARAVIGNRARIGDTWLLDAGRLGWFHLTVERFVIGELNCAEAWGVMASVVPAERTAFAQVRADYFPVRRAEGFSPVARETDVGPVAFSPSDAQRVALSAQLEAARARVWPGVRQETEESYRRMGGLGRPWPDAWKALDARVAAGEATLSYDVQAFRLTPDGDPRLFVTAEWRIGTETVFLMSAWARAGTALTIESTDVWASRGRTYAEFPASPAACHELVGEILNVVDTHRDGWGEVLSFRGGGDAMRFELTEHPHTPDGLRRVIATLDKSC